MSDGYVNLPVIGGGDGSGNVTGPGSSTTNAIAKYSDTTGTLLLNSGVLIDGSNSITTPGSLTIGASTAAVFAPPLLFVQGTFSSISPGDNVGALGVNVTTGTVGLNAIVESIGIQMNSDNTGAAGYFSGTFDTSTSSSGNDLTFSFGNYGIEGISQGPSTGIGVGVIGQGFNSLVSVGLIGQGQQEDLDDAVYVGVMGYAGNDGAGANNIGGHFFLKNPGRGSFAYHPPEISTALLADNAGYPSADIATFYSAGSEVLSIGSTGDIIPTADAAISLGIEDTNRFKNIYVKFRIGSDTNNCITFGVPNSILFLHDSAAPWQMASPNANNFDFQALSSGGQFSNIVWTTDGGGGVIGATNLGGSIVMQRPASAYIKFDTHSGVFCTALQSVTPTNGGSTTVNDFTGVVTMFISAAGTIAGYTITMPANPVNGQEVALAVQGTITSLTVNPNSGQNIIAGSISGFSTGAAWKFSASGAIWLRSY